MSKTNVLKPEIIDLDALHAELDKRENGELISHFWHCCHGAVRFIAEAAMCVKILKERGENLKGIPMMATYLRIAEGQVDPAVILTFADSPHRHRVSMLPMPDQKRLAADPVVPVVEIAPDGTPTQRRVDLTTAPKPIVDQVLGTGTISDPEEQLARLRVQKARLPVFQPIIEVEDAHERPTIKRQVLFTPSELEALKIHAAIAHISEGDMIRRFLIRAGAFKRPKT